MDRGRMWERRGGYERVEVRRGEVRKWTDVPLQNGGMGGCLHDFCTVCNACKRLYWGIYL
jgi:hypothetical protein